MGILDDVLRPHLAQVTRTFHANESTYLSFIEAHQTNAILSEQEADLIQGRNSNAESVREHGNTWFKKREFFDAIKLYTESIASAREGPIASLAYSNRFAPINFLMICGNLT
jgi:hypothetical protein